MSSSLRTRRMARNHERFGQTPKLNLVALMDIFTILVLFLMVNNGDVEVLQPDNAITLPESVSEEKPELALTIKVSADDLLLEDRKIASVSDALSQTETILPALAQELRYQASLIPTAERSEEQDALPIIIMGDQHMPYKLMKRILATCADSDYREISLAVNSVPLDPSEQAQLVAAGSTP